jgi:uncharacterized protein (DUF342 family)
MSEHSFVVGQHVHRIEDREVTGATILSIVESSGVTGVYDAAVELEYDEGGKGWWSVSTIRS